MTHLHTIVDVRALRRLDLARRRPSSAAAWRMAGPERPARLTGGSEQLA